MESCRMLGLPFFVAPTVLTCTNLSGPKFPVLTSRSHSRRPHARRPERVSCSTPAPPLPRTVVKFVDPITASTIFVIGCVHGSYASAADVKSILSSNSPDAIVLELCEPRLHTLRNMVRNAEPNKRLATGTEKGQQRRTFRQITKTFKGVPQAVLAIMLDGAYKLQTLSGLDPGVEFAHPIRNYPHNTLVCGDAPARDTVHRLYRVFVTPWASLRTSLRALTALLSRVRPQPGGINLFSVFLLDSRRARELGQLMASAALLGIALALLSSAAAFGLESSAIANSLSSPFGTSIAWETFEIIAQVLGFAYMFITGLSLFKVLIVDRDAILADRIIETTWTQACSRRRPVTICAVVGLLHVNGILQTLQDVRRDT